MTGSPLGVMSKDLQKYYWRNRSTLEDCTVTQFPLLGTPLEPRQASLWNAVGAFVTNQFDIIYIYLDSSVMSCVQVSSGKFEEALSGL